MLPLILTILLQAVLPYDPDVAVFGWNLKKFGPDYIAIIKYPNDATNLEVCTYVYEDEMIFATHCWEPKSPISDIDLWEDFEWKWNYYFEASLKQRLPDGTIRTIYTTPIILE